MATIKKWKYKGKTKYVILSDGRQIGRYTRLEDALVFLNRTGFSLYNKQQVRSWLKKVM